MVFHTLLINYASFMMLYGSMTGAYVLLCIPEEFLFRMIYFFVLGTIIFIGNIMLHQRILHDDFLVDLITPVMEIYYNSLIDGYIIIMI